MKTFDAAFPDLFPMSLLREVGVDSLEVGNCLNGTKRCEDPLGVLQVTTLGNDDEIAFLNSDLFLSVSEPELLARNGNCTPEKNISLEEV